MNELPDLTTLTSEQKDELIFQLTARGLEREARQSKNRQNSSKPPSSDGVAKKTQSLRQPSGKKPGGQAGPPGPTLKRTSEPDEIDYSPLPLRCICGREHVSAFPCEVTEAVHYGPNVRALAVHLTQGQRLPYGRAAPLIDDLYALEVSPVTLLAGVGEASDLLEPSVDRMAPADESGLRVAGKLHGLPTVVSAPPTWYGVHARRGRDAIKAQGMLPKRRAVRVHDGRAPYWPLECEHALCHAHLLRELTFLLETTGQAWNPRMRERRLAANEDGQSARQQGEKALGTEHLALILADAPALLRDGEALNPEASRIALQRGRVKHPPPLTGYADCVSTPMKSCVLSLTCPFP